jgi:mono/diheme cytochrome c family protein
MPKLWAIVLVLLAGWSALTLREVKTNTSFIRENNERLDATRAAFVGTKCIACHGTESGQMLPIRKTLNAENYYKWVRGLAPFHGYSACPAQTPEEFTDADISKTYRILYGK